MIYMLHVCWRKDGGAHASIQINSFYSDCVGGAHAIIQINSFYSDCVGMGQISWLSTDPNSAQCQYAAACLVPQSKVCFVLIVEL